MALVNVDPRRLHLVAAPRAINEADLLYDSDGEPLPWDDTPEHGGEVPELSLPPVERVLRCRNHFDVWAPQAAPWCR